MRVPVRQLADFADFLQAKNFKHMKRACKFHYPNLHTTCPAIREEDD